LKRIDGAAALTKDNLMRMINRTTVVIKPRQPFLNWINHASQLDLTSPVTMEELLEDCDTILLPVTNSREEADELLEPLKPDLFAMQLEDWLRDPGAWPLDRSAAAFDQWFALEVYSMVLDLVEEPILREGDEGFDDDLEQDLRIAAVLANVADEEEEEKALQTWKSHLEARLLFPFEAQIVEPQAHGEIKLGDQVSVFDFTGVEDQFGILVSVKTRRKRFDLPLCDLEVSDEESPNFQLVDDYAVWFANR
jgi:hypothetical protein